MVSFVSCEKEMNRGGAFSILGIVSFVFLFLFLGGFPLVSQQALAQQDSVVDSGVVKAPVVSDVSPSVPPVAAGAQNDATGTISDTHAGGDVQSGPVSAIDEGGVPSSASVSEKEVTMSPVERALHLQIDMLSPKIDVSKMKTLFFSIWEHDLIADARRGMITRPLGDDDSLVGMQSLREVSLQGILYHSAKKWTVWINKNRVTPDAIPKEIMNIKVYKTYVELEWFDADTNQIFPIRLRPQQRFELDTKMFLPGSGA